MHGEQAGSIKKKGPCRGPRFQAPREKEAIPVPSRRVPCFRRFSWSRFVSPSAAPFLLFEREIDGRRPFRKFVSGWCNGHNVPRDDRWCVPIDDSNGNLTRCVSLRKKKYFNYYKYCRKKVVWD